MHTSTISPKAIIFYRTELSERVQHEFSIILTVKDTLKYFNTRLKISRLASVAQTNRKPRLIYSSSVAPDDVTRSVNVSTDTKNNPKVIQFRSCLARVIQTVWEAHPSEGPVLLHPTLPSTGYTLHLPQCPHLYLADKSQPPSTSKPTK